MKLLHRHRPSPAMGVALVALFLSLGGGAYAAVKIGARDIERNAVRSGHIKNHQVRSADVRNHSLRGRDVRNGSLTGADIGDDSVKGADVDESTLELGLGNASARGGFCLANSGPETCARPTALDLPDSAPVLLVANGEWRTFEFDDENGPDASEDSTNVVQGECSILVNGSPIGGALRRMGEHETAPGNAPAHNSFVRSGSFALNAIEALPAGEHTLAVECRETDGDIDFAGVRLSAVVLD